MRAYSTVIGKVRYASAGAAPIARGAKRLRERKVSLRNHFHLPPPNFLTHPLAVRTVKVIRTNANCTKKNTFVD